jgi:hypothetical protein
MADLEPRPPAPPAPSDRCPRHDFPLDSAGCALCRQEAAQQAYAGGQAPLPPATIRRGRTDPAVWIVGGALTFAGCVVPLVVGTASALVAWLVFDTGAKLTVGIGLGAALATFVAVLSGK